MLTRLLSALLVLALFVACGGGEKTTFEYTLNGDEAATETSTEVVEDESADAPPAVASVLTACDAHIASLDIAGRDTTGTSNANSVNAWKTRLPKPPVFPMADDAEIVWALKTNEGSLRVKLFQNVAPMHVSSTIYLTRLGFYDGIRFHRVIPGFMAQGGCPLGTGTGSPGYKYAGEFSTNARHDSRGILSMANSGPNTDGSQFFLTFGATPHLNGKHTVFGQVEADAESQATLTRLEQLGTPQGVPPKSPIVIERATIEVE